MLKNRRCIKENNDKMAEITYKYKDAENDLNTYDGAANALESIYAAINYEFKEKNEFRIRSSIVFESGERSYDCDSLEDFKRYAFGKTISLKNIWISVSKKEILAPNLLSISYYRSTFPKKDFFEYNIVANDDLLIANIVDTMKKANNTVVHKAEIHIDNSVNIGDGNNIIGSTIGQNNSVTNDAEKSKKENLLSKISWKIVVPIIVIVVGAAICTWFGLK